MIRRIAILTVSDRGSRGEYEDRSGPIIAGILSQQTLFQVTKKTIVPDDTAAISNQLQLWVDAGIDLILTTGGTGFAARDITPEATRQIIERETPGIAEALRAESLKITRHAMLSRGIAGICQSTLIINLPGSPKAVAENMAVLLPILPHALDLINDDKNAESGHRSV